MPYGEKGWTLVTRRKLCKKQESHSYSNFPRNEQPKKNIHQHPKKKEEKNSKEDKMLNKLMTS